MPMLWATAPAVIVTAQEEDFQAHVLQRRHGLGGLGLNGIRGGDHPHRFSRHGQEDRGLALPGQLVLVSGEGFGGDALAGEKGQVSQEGLLALDKGLDPQARYGLKAIHPGQGQILGLSGVGDGLGQGVLRFLFQGCGVGQDCINAPALPRCGRPSPRERPG